MVNVSDNRLSTSEELQEILKQREQSDSPPEIDELLKELTGDLFIEAIKAQRSEIGDDFTGDRDRGILSPDDRDYLWDQSDYSYVQSEYKARDRIKDRTRNAILDFTDLEFNLSEEDRSQIFEDLSGPLDDYLVMALRFFYRGLDCDRNRLEDIIEQAIYEVEGSLQVQESQTTLRTVDVTIELDRSPDPEEIMSKFGSGRPLTDREIGVLVRSGNLTSDDLEDLADSTGEEALERILRERRGDDA